MLEAATPITVGLFWIATIGFFASGGFLIWLFRQMKGLKQEILELVTEENERTSKALGELRTILGGVEGKIMFLNEKVHVAELNAERHKAEVAEKFMSKLSAGAALERVEKAVGDVGDRLNSMEQYLRSAQMPRASRQ